MQNELSDTYCTNIYILGNPSEYKGLIHDVLSLEDSVDLDTIMRSGSSNHGPKITMPP